MDPAGGSASRPPYRLMLLALATVHPLANRGSAPGAGQTGITAEK